jgi:hypothetical protein
MKNLILLLLGIAIGFAVSYVVLGNDDSSKQPHVKAPKGIITQGQGEALNRAFNERHALISDSIVNRPDNRSTWYALQTMKDYLSYAEKETNEMGFTMDGIRIYLGAYPKSSDGVGLTTIFLIPTGTQNVSESSMIHLSDVSRDIPGASGLNLGSPGDPPETNYPNINPDN